MKLTGGFRVVVLECRAFNVDVAIEVENRATKHRPICFEMRAMDDHHAALAVDKCSAHAQANRVVK